VKVTVGEEFPHSPAAFSKFCAEDTVYPSPISDPCAFKDFIVHELDRVEYDSFVPISDPVLMNTLAIRDEVESRSGTLIPNTPLVLRAMDKLGAIELGGDMDLNVPMTKHLNQPEDLWMAFEDIGDRLFLKPRHGSGSRGVFSVDRPNAPALLPRLKRAMDEYGPYVAQQYIPGGGDQIGVYMILNYDSELRGLTVQKRIRSYPVSGGPSTYRQTIRKTAFAESVIRGLENAGWIGPCMAEFRIDPLSGEPWLVEMNARFWGSLQLSISAGVDFPAIYHRIVCDGDSRACLDYRPGITCRWMLPGDILWFLYSSERWKQLGSYLRFRNENFDIFSLEDFGPVVGTILASMRFLRKERLRYVLRENTER
jgi:predicted ATP-grasp superfamily ATP-dependent carboligase